MEKETGRKTSGESLSKVVAKYEWQPFKGGMCPGPRMDTGKRCGRY